MGYFNKNLCNYLVVRELLSDDKSDTKCCSWTVCIVIAILLLMAIGVGGGCFLLCSTCCCLRGCVYVCMALVTLPVALACLTYLAVLLIKRLPDSSKEKEMRYRFAQFCLAELNKEKNIGDVKHEDSCDAEGWFECMAEVETKIKDTVTSVSEIIRKRLKEKTDI